MPITHPRRNAMQTVAGGFSLTEILIALALLGVLLALLMPLIDRMRDQARRIDCLANQRGLSLFFLSYASDNRGAVMTCNTVDTRAANTWIWCANDGSAKLDAKGNFQGQMVPYFEEGKNRNWTVCPSMPSQVKEQKRIAYAFSDRMNANGHYSGESEGKPKFTRLNQIPAPAEQLLVIEMDTVWDGFHTIGTTTWGDPPGRRHLVGNNVVYADGHGSWYQWRDRQGTLTSTYNQVPANAADVAFLHRINVPP